LTITFKVLPKKRKKKKTFSDRITGLTGSFKRLIIDILFIQSILSKGFYVSYVYSSFPLFSSGNGEEKSL